MKQRPTGSAPQPIRSLADLRISEETLDSILGHIGRLGVETLTGWDAAATSLVEGDRVATYGATDESANDVDRAQYESEKGPCVDALGGDVHYYNGETDKARWRQFAQGAADAGVYSVVSFPLLLEDDILGALNFYSTERDALRRGQMEEGLLFAAQASVAIADARAYREKSNEIEQLSEGLRTRTLIGQATGLLMAQEGLTSEEAFQKLVKVSQTSNTKLRDIASAYITSWEDTAGASKQK